MQEDQQQHPFLSNREGNQSYESWDRMNYACVAQNYRTNRVNESPTRSPIQSPVRGPTQRRQSHYQSLSPASRAQAIARGQRELMEMVKNMPEACYELSLKDLVEHHHRQEDDRNDASSETELFGSREEVGAHEKKRSAYNDAVSRGGGARAITASSVQSHMLKMVFPLSFGPKKKKKAAVTVKEVKKSESCCNLGGGSSKNDESARTDTIGSLMGSPKASSGNSNNNVDKEWWKKRYSAEESGGDRLSSSSNSGGSKSSSTSGSRSSSLTSRSNSNNARHVSGNGGCWWFIGRRIKSGDNE